MKYVAILFCLAVSAFAAKAASISGQAGIDGNSVFAGGKLVFPRIPGINAPISSIFPSGLFPSLKNRNGNRGSTTTASPSNNQSTTSSSQSNNPSSTSSSSNSDLSSTTSSANSDSSSTISSANSDSSSTTSSANNDSSSTTSSTNNDSSSTTSSTNNDSSSTTSSSNGVSSPLTDIGKLFDIPDPTALIPDILSNGNSSGAQVPALPSLPDMSELPKIPGLSDAMQSARRHVQEALNLGSDISEGLQTAMQDAFDSDDPTNAIRTIIRTIIDAYLTVAANCPLMIVGSRVVQEGIRLAIEAARAARNVIFGTTSAPAVF